MNQRRLFTAALGAFHLAKPPAPALQAGAARLARASRAIAAGCLRHYPQVENDACAGINGVLYRSPDHAGFGGW